MGQQKYGKNETREHVDLCVIVSVFSFLYAPRYGLSEYEKKYKNKMEVRGTLVIQVPLAAQFEIWK